MRFLSFARRRDTKVVLVVTGKERMASKKVIPRKLFEENPVYNITAALKLTENHCLCRQGYIVSGTHGRIGWRNDGH